jgi:hypothetical protein
LVPFERSTASMVSGGAQPAQSSIACTAGACQPSYMMPTVGIDANESEEEAAATTDTHIIVVGYRLQIKYTFEYLY